ncbi:IMP dehydrogenase [Candidatus Haliotispira prima]|uniref:Inosine-5'-monophosphate dehydrogenase n=1 Tax=Candidatus Haliotispira prima TaxID=3034016 RepID=A0ABY8MF09_9SPIO|nr:IMP dehydrogenase [Candidatus Haliotispira prima]
MNTATKDPLQDRIAYDGLTFDDVLLIPRYAELLPGEVNLNTRLTKNIELKIPLISAAMDTVTEAELAIAMAREGGLGVLHKNMSVEQQTMMVRQVKRAESVVIQEPRCILSGANIDDALRIMQEENIGGIPVVDSQHHLKGLLTSRDLRFLQDHSKTVDDVMTPREKLVTVDHMIDLEDAAKILLQHKVEKLPITEPGTDRLQGLMTYKDITWAHDKPFACKDRQGRLRVGAALSTGTDWHERAAALIGAEADVLVLDSAHGHSKGIVELLRKLKQSWPKVEVIVGNIATAEAAKHLIEAGADALKVGIGPGSICTTRVVAGVGVPQISAICQVHSVAGKAGVPVIADGGLRYSGDIVKALAAGASCVMAGGILAGVEETPGYTIIYNGRQYKNYQGMGSLEAMQRGSGDRYFQDGKKLAKKLVPEGITARVPYTGYLADVVYQLTGGIRSGMGYCGCAQIADLQEVQFTKISNAGIRESHPHDVQITSEAPNYGMQQN